MTKIFLTIAVLIAAVGTGYLWFANRSDEPVDTVFATELKGKLDEYQKIHELSPNLSVFDDELFQILRPISTPGGSSTSTVKRGRENPFIPF